MSKGSLRPWVPTDALILAARMRDEDRREAMAAVMMDPLAAVITSLSASDRAYTGLAGGEVVCMFGVGRAALLSSVGTPWLLGTDRVAQHAREFGRMSIDALELLRQGFSSLENYADARNTVTIRWLKWLGFDIEEAKPWGALNRPFHRFTMPGIV